MGAAIGATLTAAGFDALTCLEGRSELTRTRALEANVRDAGSMDDLVRESSLLLSVLVPAEAAAVAEQAAQAMERTGARPVFAECNAIAPRTVAAIAERVGAAGGGVIDAGIIGAPPRPNRSTRIYCSGPDTSALEALSEAGLDIRSIGPHIGQASGLKMVYAASTKGTTALWTELLVAARALELHDALLAEFTVSRQETAERLMREVPGMPRRSRRWVGEMEEIAATFEALGLTPRMMQGAADLFRFVGQSPLADQTSREPDPPLDALLQALADRLPSDE
ncbi:MAG: NAD(P)-dependent oxidoreductase [Dehalococcoidia bacterium]|nr:NAD(P)-dependent oxidoreductase [Dehalococcoidia bacterium]